MAQRPQLKYCPRRIHVPAVYVLKRGTTVTEAMKTGARFTTYLVAQGDSRVVPYDLFAISWRDRCHSSRRAGDAVTSIFSRNKRNTDFTEKYFPHVDATEEFPLLVAKMPT